MAADTTTPPEADLSPIQGEKPVGETDRQTEQPPQSEAVDASIGQSTSFKEESDSLEKALDELRHLLPAALHHDLRRPPSPPPPADANDKPLPQPKKLRDCLEAENASEEPAELEEVHLWGVPLLSGGERSNTVLLKFLRARDFRVKDALAMIKSTILWRVEFGVDELLEEDLGLEELNRAVYVHGVDREGHPLCYHVFGEFQDEELYHKAFGDEEKRTKFFKWMVQFLEKAIRTHLDFSADGISTIVHIFDLKDSPQLYRKEFRHAYKHALHVLQDNYPELVAKQVHINVPWWYLAFNRMMGTFMTPRTRSKLVFAGPSKSAETLFKYVAPEQVPALYGGMDWEKGPDFCKSDPVVDVMIRPSSKQIIEIPVSEACLVVWELRVLGWDVCYGAEFTPNAEGGYTVVIQKTRKFSSSNNEVEKNRFRICEPGKIFLFIDNCTSKKKKLLYRFKIKSSTESN